MIVWICLDVQEGMQPLLYLTSVCCQSFDYPCSKCNTPCWKCERFEKWPRSGANYRQQSAHDLENRLFLDPRSPVCKQQTKSVPKPTFGQISSRVNTDDTCSLLRAERVRVFSADTGVD